MANIIPPTLQNDFLDETVDKKSLMEKIKYLERENGFLISEISEVKKAY